MKIITFYFLTFAALLFSCGKSTVTLNQADLVGRWVDTGEYQAFVITGTDTIPTIFRDVAYNLYADGSFDVDNAALGQDIYEQGNWTYDAETNMLHFEQVLEPFVIDSVIITISNPSYSTYTWSDIELENDASSLKVNAVRTWSNAPFPFETRRTFIRQ